MLESNGFDGGGGGDADRHEEPGEGVDDNPANVVGSPKNGWRVEEDYGDAQTSQLSLDLVLIVDLKPIAQFSSWTGPDSHENRGRMSRELILLQAVVQYLNSGGNPASSLEYLAKLAGGDYAHHQKALIAIEMPEGYELLLTRRIWFSDDDGDRERVEHLFISSEAEEAIRWIEDVLIERIPFKDLMEEIERDRP
jgi:hypothetical protein